MPLRMYALVSPPALLPRDCVCGADENRLLASDHSSRLPGFHQWLNWEKCCVRYSGGAAPALHRFPWSPSARSVFSYAANLRRLALSCKRELKFLLELLAFRLVRGSVSTLLRCMGVVERGNLSRN